MKESASRDEGLQLRSRSREQWHRNGGDRGGIVLMEKRVQVEKRLIKNGRHHSGVRCQSLSGHNIYNALGTKMTSVGTSPTLKIEELSIDFVTYSGISHVIEKVNIEVNPGEIVGLVGESGCGKTVTTKAILGTLPRPPGKITSGRVVLRGVDILSLGDREFQLLRKKEVGLIPQDPTSSLNPVVNIETQMTNILRWQNTVDESISNYLRKRYNKQERLEARKIAIAMLCEVNIGDPERVLKSYPFELSG